MKIVISEFMDEAAVELMKAAAIGDIIYQPDLVDRPDDLMAMSSDADVIIVRNRTQVKGDLLANAQNLKWVGRLGVGLDNIDVAECGKRDIVVQPATGANAQSVAEYVMASMMMLLRSPAYAVNGEVISGLWPRQPASAGFEIGGKTLGLIGYGTISKEVARRAKACDMTIIAHDPMLDEADVPLLPLNELFAQSDVISLHVPLTDGTKNLIDENALSQMKSTAVVINTARGGIIDEAALCEALKSGKIAGAALDVFASEPLNKETGARFKDIPNLILTPHVAGVTADANTRVSGMIAEKAIEFARSK